MRRYFREELITGHGKTAAPNPDWAPLAKLNLTLVIYMGITRCAEIQAALLAGGKRSDTPVALVQSATGTEKAQLITTLSHLLEALAASGLSSPGIIVIGDVVRCAASVELPKANAA